jgi:hypothetical protein
MFLLPESTTWIRARECGERRGAQRKRIKVSNARRNERERGQGKGG